MKDFEITPEMLDQLPPNLRAEMRRRIFEVLAFVGVTPSVDTATGEVVIDVKALAKGFGISAEEVIADAGSGNARVLPAERIDTLQ